MNFHLVFRWLAEILRVRSAQETPSNGILLLEGSDTSHTHLHLVVKARICTIKQMVPPDGVFSAGSMNGLYIYRLEDANGKLTGKNRLMVIR